MKLTPDNEDAENETHRRIKMLLEKKNAIIYGAGGAIGGAVARAFAREGADFVASERAAAMTDSIVNLTCGSLVD